MYRKYPNSQRPLLRFREEWNGKITTTLFSYFSFQELVYLGGVWRIFNEITGSKAVLSFFNDGKREYEATIDHVLPDMTKDSIQQAGGMSYRIASDVSLNSDQKDYLQLPYKFVVKEKNEEKKKKIKFPKIRVNSISPVSQNSSWNEVDYDIIKDDVGYGKLVGKIFFNSIRSNSSKYISEASNFKHPSELDSSRYLESGRDETLSGRMNRLALVHPKGKAKFEFSNTHTEGFLKHQNFLISPTQKQIGKKILQNEIPFLFKSFRFFLYLILIYL